MATAEWPVQIYIYDLSKGLAKSVSYALLGKQIDGIWHTAVVIYGQEFFYGGTGIESCEPRGTVLGSPDTVVDLGKTEVPCDVFMDHLQELSKTEFRPTISQVWKLFHKCGKQITVNPDTWSPMPRDYDLMGHNCNTFTNELAVFLTGRSIPRYVTDLPQDILNSPFGAMMKPFLDSMSVNPQGGHRLFEESTPHSSSGPSTRPKTESKNNDHSGKTRHDKNTIQPEDVMFKTDSVLKDVSEMRSTFKGAMPKKEWHLLKEVIEYVSSADCLWSLGREHIKVFGTLLDGDSLDTRHKVVVGRLLTLAVTRPGVLDMLRFDKKMELMKLVNSVDHLQPVIQVSLAQTLANCGSCKAGHEWLLNTTDWPIDSHITNNGKIVCNSCIHWLLHENSELNSAAAALAFALTRHKVSSNVAMEIGTALIQLATKKLSLTDGEHVLQSVYKCMSINQEVVDLASIMQLDLGKFSSLSPKLKSVCKKIQERMAMKP